MLYMTQIKDDPNKIAAQCQQGDKDRLAKRIAKENSYALAMRVFPNASTMGQYYPIWIPTENDPTPQERRMIVQRFQSLPLKQRILLTGMQKNGIDIMPGIAAQAIAQEANSHLADILKINKVDPSLSIASGFFGLNQGRLNVFQTALNEYASALKEFSLQKKFNISGSMSMPFEQSKQRLHQASTTLHQYSSELLSRYKLQKNRLLQPMARGASVSALAIYTTTTADNIAKSLKMIKWTGYAGTAVGVAGGAANTIDAYRNGENWYKVAAQETVKFGGGFTGGIVAGEVAKGMALRNGLLAGRLIFGLSPWGIVFFVGLSAAGYLVGNWMGEEASKQIDKWW